MKEKHIVSFRNADCPINEYPKGTFFAQDHNDIVIPMPAKEELKEYKKKHDTTSQRWQVVFYCCNIATEREVKAKCRKEPMIVEAFQWTGGSEQEENPVWIIRTIKNGITWFKNTGTLGMKPMIRTLEGIHEVGMGDYIIQGIAGEIYPCKPNVLLTTYEPTVTKISMNVTTHLDGDEAKHEADGL